MIEYIRGTVHVNSAGGKGQTEMMRKSEWMEDLVPWMQIKRTGSCCERIACRGWGEKEEDAWLWRPLEAKAERSIAFYTVYERCQAQSSVKYKN